MQAKLSRFDELEQKYRTMAKKVKKEDIIQAQVASLFQAGILAEDENGNVVVDKQISREQFLDFEQEDEGMDEDASPEKRKRYNDFGLQGTPPQQQEGDRSAFDNRHQ